MPRKLIWPAAVITLVAGFSPAGAAAGTINVNTTADEFLGANNGVCSLREAISVSNNDIDAAGCTGSGGADTIALPAGTYTITRAGSDNTNVTGDFDVLDVETLTIEGTGVVVVDGGGVDRVFDHAAGGELTINNLTISGGAVDVMSQGGGIINRSGLSLVMSRSTIADNSAGDDGGGLANFGTASLFNVTVSNNRANNDGGGIYAPSGGFTTLRNATVAFNTADFNASGAGDGGGISATGTINVYNSIISDNSDLSFAPVDQSPECATGPSNFFPRYTLIRRYTAMSCPVAFTPGTNITGQDPRLAPLALNGGTTATHALQEGSPAIDAGGEVVPEECEAVDQRGVPRPQRLGCDLGSFELQPLPPPPVIRCDGRIATILGTGARNVITGTPGRDVIAALGGNDKVVGRGGNDLICGGGGKDTLLGRGGKDKLLGQAGADVLRGERGRDFLKGGAGADRLFGGPGLDRLRGGAGSDVQKQ